MSRFIQEMVDLSSVKSTKTDSFAESRQPTNKFLMTAIKKLTVTSVLFLMTFFISCTHSSDSNSNTLATLIHKNEIVVAIDMDMPGYFAIDDENFGYQYDLLQAYADKMGVQLRVVNGNNTPSESRKLLYQGEADMIAALASNVGAAKISVPLYNTSFVMLAEKREARLFKAKAREALGDALNGKRILVSSAFTATKSFGVLLETIEGSEVMVSVNNCLDMAEMLRAAEYDYIVCEKSEAQMAMALIGGVTQVYDFVEKLQINIALNQKDKQLQEHFENWLKEYRNSAEYAMLNELYFEKGIVGQMITKGSKKSLRRGISNYDHLMREISRSEGLDWRLLSAIAYHESRFNENVVSPVGARGLMQIMPVVARQFSVPQEDMMRPEVNIMLAAKLIKKMESMLKFKEGTPLHYKTSIMLACYNCGIGHVLDARRLATKYGYNPDSWDDVSLFLQKKAEPEYNQDAVVKNGRFTKSGSNQTLAFVSNVMGLYSNYCVTNRP